MAWRRALACEFIGTIGTEQSVEVLVRRLRDIRVEVRIAAAWALGQLGHAAAAAPLKAIFLEHEHIPVGVVNDALLGLGPAGADAFRQGLASPHPTVRVTSCFGVAAQGEVIGTTQALHLLERRLRDDEEPRVRAAAASAMRRLPKQSAPAALIEALRDPALAVRRSAARSAAAFDDPAAVDALAGMLSDADRETALRAAESLLALSGGARAGEQTRSHLLAGGWTVDSAKAMAGLGA